jgi:hypothetical protein
LLGHAVGYALAVELGHCDAMMGCARGVAAGQEKDVGGLHMGKRDGAMQAVAHRKKHERKERKGKRSGPAGLPLGFTWGRKEEKKRREE